MQRNIILLVSIFLLTPLLGYSNSVPECILVGSLADNLSLESGDLGYQQEYNLLAAKRNLAALIDPSQHEACGIVVQRDPKNETIVIVSVVRRDETIIESFEVPRDEGIGTEELSLLEQADILSALYRKNRDRHRCHIERGMDGGDPHRHDT